MQFVNLLNLSVIISSQSLLVQKKCHKFSSAKPGNQVGVLGYTVVIPGERVIKVHQNHHS